MKPNRKVDARVSALRAVVLGAMALLLAGCGLFGGAGEAPTPMPTRTPFPTFTPTPEALLATAPAAPSPTIAAATQPVAAAQPVTSAASSEVAVAAPPTPEPTATPAAASLTIASDLVNVRGGPGTEFDLVGTAATGETFAIIGSNAARDWWQVCCVGDQNGWVFGELATVQNVDNVVAVADAVPAAPVAEAVPTTGPEGAAVDATVPTAALEAASPEATPTTAPAAASAPYDPNASSAGNFDPNAQYQIVNFRVLGLGENNGGIRDSGAQHLIFVTVLDQNGNGVDGAVLRDLVGNEKNDVTTGNKGPGKTELTMAYDPFKLTVVSDPSGPVTSQVSNQMGLIFPHLPDIVGKLGDASYEYGVCPTIDVKCGWPLSDYQYVHFSYEITFQKVK